MLVNLEERDLNVTKNELLVLKHIAKTLSYFF